jgi:hypothetical protein
MLIMRFLSFLEMVIIEDCPSAATRLAADSFNQWIGYYSFR